MHCAWNARPVAIIRHAAQLPDEFGRYALGTRKKSHASSHRVELSPANRH